MPEHHERISLSSKAAYEVIRRFWQVEYSQITRHKMIVRCLVHASILFYFVKHIRPSIVMFSVVSKCCSWAPKSLPFAAGLLKLTFVLYQLTVRKNYLLTIEIRKTTSRKNINHFWTHSPHLETTQSNFNVFKIDDVRISRFARRWFMCSTRWAGWFFNQMCRFWYFLRSPILAQSCSDMQFSGLTELRLPAPKARPDSPKFAKNCVCLVQRCITSAVGNVCQSFPCFTNHLFHLADQ